MAKFGKFTKIETETNNGKSEGVKYVIDFPLNPADKEKEEQLKRLNEKYEKVLAEIADKQ